MATVSISELFPTAGAHSQRPDEPSTSPSFFACSEHSKVYRWNGAVWQDWIDFASDSVSDHGGLSGLADDDHTQYHNDARGDARYYTQTQVDTTLEDYALATHDHDADYAALAHDHDADYSALGHNHDADYADIAHNHDADYADIAHDHDADYAALAHNHAASDINSGRLGVDRLPEASPLVADKIKNGGTVPARPTADTDVPVLWVSDTDPDTTQSPENGDFWLEY